MQGWQLRDGSNAVLDALVALCAACMLITEEEHGGACNVEEGVDEELCTAGAEEQPVSVLWMRGSGWETRQPRRKGPPARVCVADGERVGGWAGWVRCCVGVLALPLCCCCCPSGGFFVAAGQPRQTGATPQPPDRQAPLAGTRASVPVPPSVLDGRCPPPCPCQNALPCPALPFLLCAPLLCSVRLAGVWPPLFLRFLVSSSTLCSFARYEGRCAEPWRDERR